MTLDDVTHSSAGVSLETIGADRPLAKEIQDRLSLAGLLDPPSDGMFGPVSHWALDEFCKAKGLDFELTVTPAIAAALQDDAIKSLFPLNPGNDLAGKIVSAMQRNNYWI